MAPADVVLYPKHTGSDVAVEVGEHLILEATDLLAVLRAPAVAA